MAVHTHRARRRVRRVGTRVPARRRPVIGHRRRVAIDRHRRATVLRRTAIVRRRIKVATGRHRRRGTVRLRIIVLRPIIQGPIRALVRLGKAGRRAVRHRKAIAHRRTKVTIVRRRIRAAVMGGPSRRRAPRPIRRATSTRRNRRWPVPNNRRRRASVCVSRRRFAQAAFFADIRRSPAFCRRCRAIATPVPWHDSCPSFHRGAGFWQDAVGSFGHGPAGHAKGVSPEPR